MLKDPDYDRYKGFVSLPGDPLNPENRRPYRVDEDGIKIYQDEELEAIRGLGGNQGVQLAELGRPDWHGSDAMRAHGARDGHSLKALGQTVPNPDAVPPAGGVYDLPEGTKMWAGDASGRLILGKDGKIIKNPNYQKVIDATRIDRVGVAKDLAMAAGGVGFALRKGAMTLGAAQLMPATTGAKQAYALEKMRRAEKRRND